LGRLADERSAVDARVTSADQKADLDPWVAWVSVWTTGEQIPVDKVVVEVGSALNGHRRKFVGLLASGRAGTAPSARWRLRQPPRSQVRADGEVCSP
jgi:predicted site-specific integrase-resolvase